MAKRKMPVLGKREWKHLIKDFATDQAIADHFGVTRQTVFLNRKKVMSDSKTALVENDSKTEESVVDKKIPKTVQEPKPIKGRKKTKKTISVETLTDEQTPALPWCPQPTASSRSALFKKPKGKKKSKKTISVETLTMDEKKLFKKLREIADLIGTYVYKILTKNS